MHSEIALPDHVQEYLRGVGVPVRVLNGSGWNYSPPPSWRGAAGANNASLATCQEQGVTLVSYGSQSVRQENPLAYHPTMPASIAREGAGEVAMSRDWLVPSTSVGLVQSDGEPAIAQVGDRVIWYHVPLHTMLWEHVDLDTVLGDPIRRSLDASAERVRAASEAARDAFVAASRNNRGARLTRLRDEIAGLETQLTNYERSARTTLAGLKTRSQEIEFLESQTDDQDESLARQFELLVNHPKVATITTEGGYRGSDHIAIETIGINMLYEDEGESVYLGRIKIVIPPPGSGDADEFVRMYNLDNEREGRAHPHVGGGGVPCFGDSHGIFYDTWQAGEITALFELCLQFLESFNPEDSWGAYARYWRPGYQTPAEREEAAVYAEERYDDEGDGCDCEECVAARQG